MSPDLIFSTLVLKRRLQLVGIWLSSSRRTSKTFLTSRFETTPRRPTSAASQKCWSAAISGAPRPSRAAIFTVHEASERVPNVPDAHCGDATLPGAQIALRGGADEGPDARCGGRGGSLLHPPDRPNGTGQRHLADEGRRRAGGPAGRRRGQGDRNRQIGPGVLEAVPAGDAPVELGAQEVDAGGPVGDGGDDVEPACVEAVDVPPGRTAGGDEQGLDLDREGAPAGEGDGGRAAGLGSVPDHGTAVRLVQPNAAHLEPGH